MNKRVFKLIVSSFLVTSLLFSTTVYALDDHNQESTVLIGLKAGGNAPIVKPLDPTAPVNPDPDHPGETVTGIALMHVSSLNFGDMGMPLTGFDFHAPNEDFYMQVTDLRGTFAGWNVQAKLSEFTHATNPIAKLTGSKLVLKNGVSASSVKDYVTTGKILVDATVELPSNPTLGAKTLIAKALIGEGYGTTVVRWMEEDPLAVPLPTINSKVYLYIPKDSFIIGAYNAKIEWVLSNTP